MPKDDAIPPEDAQLILSAAAELMFRAPPLVKDNPQYAIGALSVALGTAAAMALVPYPDLIDMLSRHYEQELLRQVNEELGTAETLLPKSEQSQ